MSDPFLGEIKIAAFGFPPKGWAYCNGQLLPINQNQALFSLLGTTYGGNGVTTFALPDLRGRMPFHCGGGLVLGQRGGEQAHTLSVAELPQHTHLPQAGNTADQSSPAGCYWGHGGTVALYGSSADAYMATAAVAFVGGSQAHPNMPPYLALNFCIALQGIFPSQS